MGNKKNNIGFSKISFKLTFFVKSIFIKKLGRDVFGTH